MPPYRIAVIHKDKEHPHGTVSHHGPAFDEAFRQAVAHVKDVDPGEIDLLEEARASLKRARHQFPAKDGFTVELHDLTDKGFRPIKED